MRSSDLTFGELRHRVDRIAWSLIGLGIERGDVVSVQLAELVAFRRRSSRLPADRRDNQSTDADLPRARIRLSCLVLRNRRSSSSRRCFGISITRTWLSGSGIRFQRCAMSSRSAGPARIVSIRGSSSADVPADAAEIFRPRQLRRDDVVQLLYTSGTTGEPKGVMHTSRTLMRTMLPGIDHLQLRTDEPILSATPLAHQLGFILAVIVPIVLGSPIVMQDVWNANVALERIRKYGVTFGMGATPFLADLIDHRIAKQGDAGSLRTFLSAGAPIPATAGDAGARGDRRQGAVGLWHDGKSPGQRDAAGRSGAEGLGNRRCAELGLELRVVDPDRKVIADRPGGTAADARHQHVRRLSQATRTLQRRQAMAGSTPATSPGSMRTATSPSPAAGRT